MFRSGGSIWVSGCGVVLILSAIDDKIHILAGVLGRFECIKLLFESSFNEEEAPPDVVAKG